MPHRNGLLFTPTTGAVAFREPGRPRIESRLLRVARLLGELSPDEQLAVLASVERRTLEAAVVGQGRDRAAIEGLIERRAQVRRRYSERARLLLDHGERALECRIVEWSAGGRRLSLENPALLPKIFQLVGEGMAAPVTAELIWRDDRRAGLRIRS